MRLTRGAPNVRGLSLVETCITICVLAILLSIAIPSFLQLRQRIAIEGTARQLAGDLHYARGEAVARAQSLRISFSGDATSSCYVIHTGAANDCVCAADGHAQCEAGAQALKSVRLATTEDVRILSNAQSMLFDGLRGTVSPSGTVRVIGASGHAVHQIVNVLGRMRTCSPQPALPGYRAC